MNQSIQTISLLHLSLAFLPLLIVIVFLVKWSSGVKDALYALFRMVVQLLLVGYLLTFIFNADSAFMVLTVLVVMISASSWISLRTVKAYRWSLLGYSALAIALGGVITLLVITQGVLSLKHWYTPQMVIPLAGMIFANAMNSVSLCAERMVSELCQGTDYDKARQIAYRTSLIPMINALFAVGLVSLPGMMTGQILSGVSPLIAVRYQIMVMCMVFASAGIASACFLILCRGKLMRLPAADSHSSLS